jgi:hypothetical protein
MAKSTATKATKPEAMSSEQKRLATMEDADDQPGVPSSLVELGLQFKRAQKKEAESKANTKEIFTSIKDQMHKAGLTKFRLEIDGKRKWLKLDPVEKLKWEEAKPPKTAASSAATA